MGAKLRKIIIIIAAIVFAVSLFMVIKPLFYYYMGDKAYSEAMEIAGVAGLTALPDTFPDTSPERETEIEPDPVTEENTAVGPVHEAEPDHENESVSEAEPGSETETKSKPKAAAETVQEPEPVPQISFEEMLASVNIDALKAYNSDVVGWIAVPYTVLSYPVLQSTDNDYYLNHTWNKKYNAVGSIFLDYNASPDFSDFNTIIYGHRMGNGTMFNSLAYYADYYYWKSNPKIYIVTEDGIKCYDVYSSYEASVDSITYAVGLTDSTAKQEFIKHTVDSSVIDTGIVPEEDDLILTLSTCTRSGGKETRWVVHAVLSTND